MSMSFRKAWRGPALTRDEGARQGRAVRTALSALGDVDARAFLNGHHSGLRGRPLDLAVASAAGLLAVEAAIGVQADMNSEGRR